MIIWNSSFFPALYSSCSELNHKKIQYCSSSGLSRLCSSFLDLSNFLISGKSSNEKKPETRNSWNEEFPETRKILKRGISWNEEILSHHRLLCFITNIKRNTAGLSARPGWPNRPDPPGWPDWPREAVGELSNVINCQYPVTISQPVSQWRSSVQEMLAHLKSRNWALGVFTKSFRFPVDEQYCQVKFESFGFTNKQVCHFYLHQYNAF